MPLCDYASHPKYPWRSMRVRGTFFVPFTEEEMQYPKLRTKKRKLFFGYAYKHTRYSLVFSIKRAKLGLLIRRIE